MGKLKLNHDGVPTINTDLEDMFVERNEKIKEYIDNHVSPDRGQSKLYYYDYGVNPVSGPLNKEINSYSYINNIKIFNLDNVVATDFKKGDLIYDNLGTVAYISVDYTSGVELYGVRTITNVPKAVLELQLGVNAQISRPNSDGRALIPLSNVENIEGPGVYKLINQDDLTNIQLPLNNLLLSIVDAFSDKIINETTLSFRVRYEGYEIVYPILKFVFINETGNPGDLRVEISLTDVDYDVVFVSYLNENITWRPGDYEVYGVRYDFNSKLVYFIDNKFINYQVNPTLPIDPIGNVRLIGWVTRHNNGLIVPDSNTIDINGGVIEVNGSIVQGASLGINGEIIYPNNGVLPIPLADMNHINNPCINQMITGDNLSKVYIDLESLLNDLLIPEFKDKSFNNVRFYFNVINDNVNVSNNIFIYMSNNEGDPDTLSIEIDFATNYGGGTALLYNNENVNYGQVNYEEQGIIYDSLKHTLSFNSPSNHFKNYQYSSDIDIDQILNHPLSGYIIYKDLGIIDPESDTITVNNGRLEINGDKFIKDIKLGHNGRVLEPVDGTVTLPLANHEGLVNPNLLQIEEETSINSCHLELEYIHMIWFSPGNTRNLNIKFSNGYTLYLSSSGSNRFTSFILYNPNINLELVLFNGSSWLNQNYVNEHVEYADTILTLSFENMDYIGYENGGGVSGFSTTDLNHILESIIVYGHTGEITKGLVDPASRTIDITNGKLEIKQDYAEVIELGENGDIVESNEGKVTLPLANMVPIDNKTIASLVHNDDLSNLSINVNQLLSFIFSSFNNQIVQNLDIYLNTTIKNGDGYNPYNGLNIYINNEVGTYSSMLVVVRIMEGSVGYKTVFVKQANGDSNLSPVNLEVEGIKYTTSTNSITFSSPSNRFNNYTTNPITNPEQTNQLLNYILQGYILHPLNGVINPESESIDINEGVLEVKPGYVKNIELGDTENNIKPDSDGKLIMPSSSTQELNNVIISELLSDDDLSNASINMAQLLNLIMPTIINNQMDLQEYILNTTVNHYGEYNRLVIQASNTGNTGATAVVKIQIRGNNNYYNIFDFNGGGTLNTNSFSIEGLSYNGSNYTLSFNSPSNTVLSFINNCEGINYGLLNGFNLNGSVQRKIMGLISPKSDTLNINNGLVEVKNVGWCSLGNITFSNADISLSFRDFRIYKYGDKNVYIPVVNMSNIIVNNNVVIPPIALSVDIDLETTTGTLNPRDILEYGSNYQLYTEYILRVNQSPTSNYNKCMWSNIWFINTSTIRFEVKLGGFYTTEDYSHSSMIAISSSFNLPR